MRRARSAALIVLVTAGTLPVAAEVLKDGRALNPTSPLAKYLFSQEFLREMYEAAVKMDRALGIACTDQYTIRPVDLFVVDPIDFPEGATHAASGEWVQRYDAVRCATTKRFNMIFEVQPDGTTHSRMLLPGNTMASLRLMLEAIPGVGAAASAELGKDCRDTMIADTKVAQGPHRFFEGGKAFEGVWIENWTVQGCGKTMVARIRFIPDGKNGTHFTILK
jgi:hypothetical protein